MNPAPMTDDDLWQAFHDCRLTPATFRHREHLRIAYLHLARFPLDQAHWKLRRGLMRMLRHLGAPISHHHETLTRAWLMAVDHFINLVGRRENSEAFLSACGCLLNQRIMLTHYRAESLHSPTARRKFVEPDLQPIPRHDHDS